MSNDLHPSWKTHFVGKHDAQSIEDFERTLRSNTIILGTLSNILTAKLASRDSVPLDHPNWAIAQSHNEGYRRAVKDLLVILPKTGGNNK